MHWGSVENEGWKGSIASFVPFSLLAETNIKIALSSFQQNTVSEDLLSDFSYVIQMKQHNSSDQLKQIGNPQKYNHLCYKQGSVTCKQSNVLL